MRELLDLGDPWPEAWRPPLGSAHLVDAVASGIVHDGSGDGHVLDLVQRAAPGERAARRPLPFDRCSEIEALIDALAREARALGHETRNVAARVLAVVESVIDDLDRGAGSDARAALDGAYADARRILQITRTQASLLSTRDVAPVPLADAIDEAVVQARTVLGPRDIRLRMRIEALEPGRHVHATYVESMLRGLVDNAARAAAPTGAPVDLVVEPLAGCPGWVRVAVTDAGPGMSPEQLWAAGEVLRSNRRAGQGLGLFLSRWGAAECGGFVTLQSKPREGTTATLLLPSRSA